MRVAFRTRCLFLSIAFLVASLLLPSLVSAQGPTDIGEIETFFDGEIEPAMRDQHLAGVALVLVRDGEILFAKGYGYADVARAIPVNPEMTLFRMGSSSKLFAWTAVMQLAERGQIDLDADISAYLDFELPATYPEPVTLRHLLAHTAGFEDRNYGMRARTPDEIVPLGEWLPTHIPARVRPAGEYASYSNYGAALAGYIVERVSGMSYAAYVTEHILQPLGMAHSSAEQPLPPDLAAHMAQGYVYRNGAYVPQPFELYNISPAGASSTTATDVARFMIAHLQDGRYGEARILESETAQRMHDRLFSHDPRINGMAYGFIEKDRNGLRIIGHGGDTNLFHTQLALLPDEGIGFYVACNSAESMGTPGRLLSAFVDHYYPESTIHVPTTDWAERAALVEGAYRLNRMSYTTAESVLSLTRAYSFRMLEDGTLALAGRDWTFVETEPYVYRQTNGPRTVVFRSDGRSPATHAFLSSTPHVALERTPAAAGMVVQLGIVGFSAALLVSFLVAGLVRAIARRKRGLAAEPRLARAASWALTGASVTCLAVAALFALAAPGDSLMLGDIPLQGLTPLVHALMKALTVLSLCLAVYVWQNRYWRAAGRVHYTLVVLAAGAFVWVANYWHLMHW